MPSLTENPAVLLKTTGRDTKSGKDALLAAADRCVMCGLCLPHCPTYLLSANENRSPRGRIALIKAFAENQLEATTTLIQHLDSCLLCRNCESMCPSKVTYGELFDRAQAMIAASGKRQETRSFRFLKFAVENSFRLMLLDKMLHIYQKSGLQWLLRRGRVLQLLDVSNLDHLLPPLRSRKHLKSYYPAKDKTHGETRLFTGCVTRIIEQSVIEAGILVLTHLGFDVHVPRNQACCGALHRHSGDCGTADTLMEKNRSVFTDDSMQTILTFATGCSATLQEHGNFHVRDITSFLASQDWSSLHFRPSSKRIMLHIPCTAKNAMGDDAQVKQLLQSIPDTEITLLPENQICCGAGGSHLLSQSVVSEQLRDRIVSVVRDCMPDRLLTTNTGCALHLRAGLQSSGLNVEVQHPVEFIAEHLV